MAKPTGINFIYITCKDKKQALVIGGALVKERLAACANIIDGVDSIYWWNNRVQNAKEAVLICKTRTSLVPSLIKKVKKIHSYTCPCIVSLPITSGSKEYLAWIKKETLV